MKVQKRHKKLKREEKDFSAKIELSKKRQRTDNDISETEKKKMNRMNIQFKRFEEDTKKLLKRTKEDLIIQLNRLKEDIEEAAELGGVAEGGEIENKNLPKISKEKKDSRKNN